MFLKSISNRGCMLFYHPDLLYADEISSGAPSFVVVAVLIVCFVIANSRSLINHGAEFGSVQFRLCPLPARYHMCSSSG
jgi:hypothetical protein